ncbi:hypothetical protein FOZ62_001014 [Perkinsus olseni]|uniref:Protein kinase domain-containing protein n=1 Tax=Perkinsus olseni TaxID=32597 RepID=A0A7J6RRG2_PEROL|nr:hypothetical protein FOZ62_001014 [Perkinsus olseni]
MMTYNEAPHRPRDTLVPPRPSESGARTRSRFRGTTEESQRRIVDKVIRRHCVKHHRAHHQQPSLELDAFGPPLPSTSTMLSPQDKLHLPPISPNPCVSYSGTPPAGQEAESGWGQGRPGQQFYGRPSVSSGTGLLPIVAPKTPSRYQQQCTPSHKAFSGAKAHRDGRHSEEHHPSRGQRTPGRLSAIYVDEPRPEGRLRRQSHGRIDENHHSHSSGRRKGRRSSLPKLEVSPTAFAPRLPRELPPLDLASLPSASPSYPPLTLDTPAAFGWMMTPKSPHGAVWTPIERPPSPGVNCRAVPSTVDTIIEADDEQQQIRLSHNSVAGPASVDGYEPGTTLHTLPPPRMSLSPSPPAKHPPPAEVHVSGVVELGPEAHFVQSPAKPKKTENAVSDSAVVFRSPGEERRSGKRRPRRVKLRRADGAVKAADPSPPPGPNLRIDTSLEDEDCTPPQPTSKRQAEMFSLDDTCGHLRLSRLSGEGVDTTVIVAEKDISWIGESPDQTDTEGSDVDKITAIEKGARSPTGPHFHVWVKGEALRTGQRHPDGRKRREARRQQKGRVVQQFREAVYEHQRAEEQAKRQVLLESLSSSAGVIDMMNIKKGERIRSRMPTMSTESGWIRGKALGAGTSATVYLAQRSVDGFLFVAKEVPLSGKGLLWRDLPRDIRNEAVVLSRARHIAGVVEFFGCEVIDDKFYIYMEYLGGGTLASLAPSSPSKRLPEQQAAWYLRRILRTLRALHHGAGGLTGSQEGIASAIEDKGELITPIMHRDVKGTNCLLTTDRQTVKLCDFGSCTRPRPFSFVGTPLAAAGEKLNESIDLTSDIPPDCHAIVDDSDQVVGFAPVESTLTGASPDGEADACLSAMDSSISTSGLLRKQSAEKRYEDPQFFFRSMKGTLRWMAPETLGGSDYSAKVDVWSVGCLLIEMVCGRDPWKEFDNEIQAMHEIWTARDKTPIDYIPPDVWDLCSESCKDFMRKTVQRDPQARPTCAELLQHPFIKDNS